MKVAELIAILQTFPPDKYVVLDGYEGGLHFPEVKRVIQVHRDEWSSSYYGPHEEVTSDELCDFEAVYLERLDTR